MANPFYLQVIPDDRPLCNRTVELRELSSFAQSGANVVLYSPRRYGKTSLVRRVQRDLAAAGAVTVFVDFFGVSSVDEVAARFANAVFAFTHSRDPLWKKALTTIRSFRPVLKPDPESGFSLSVESSGGQGRGIPLLEETLDSFGRFIEQVDAPVHVALDEFQEIVTLDHALEVEAAFRTRIQNHKASYFFVGSRRRILLGIFTDSQRPFFQTAINYPLPRLPADELEDFVRAQFSGAGRRCSRAASAELVAAAAAHPYYTEKLAFLVYELSRTVDARSIADAHERLLASERPVFEATVLNLPPGQRRLLQALAREPTPHLLAASYLAAHSLGSVGGVQHASRKLEELDLIERTPADDWTVVDPVFAEWLNRQRERRVE